MYQKHNRFYADWRDKRGKRRRKAFTTPEAAELHDKRNGPNPTQNSTARQDDHSHLSRQN